MSDLGRYGDAVEMKAAALYHILRRGGRQELLESYAEDGVNPQVALAVTDALIAQLRNGSPYYWSREMNPLLAWDAALGLPDDWVWHRSKLLTPAGFLWFQEPIPQRDEDGTAYDMVGLSWHIFILGRGTKPSPGDGYRVLHEDKKGTITEDDRVILSVTVWGRGAGDWPFGYPQAINFIEEGVGVDAFAGRTEGRASGVDLSMTTDASFITRGILPTRRNRFKLIGSILEILQQKIASRSRHVPERHVRRRLEREHPDLNPEVEIIRLRRQSSARTDQQGEAPDWSCRWMVRPHWHTYRVGPGRQEKKLVLLASYVKGPPDRPLRVAGHKIFAAVR